MFFVCCYYYLDFCFDVECIRCLLIVDIWCVRLVVWFGVVLIWFTDLLFVVFDLGCLCLAVWVCCFCFVLSIGVCFYLLVLLLWIGGLFGMVI